MSPGAKRCSDCAQEIGTGGALKGKKRLKFRLCGAPTADGGRCGSLAGLGTDHFGYGRCRKHAGNSRKNRRAATIEEATVQMVALGAPVDIKPHAALMGLLRMTAGHVAHLHERIGTLEDVSSRESQVLITMYDAERDRLARISQACITAGIAERWVRIEETKVEALSVALVRAADAAGFDDAQKRRLGAALRQELAKLPTEGSSEDGIWGRFDGDAIDAKEIINSKEAA